MKKSNKYDYYEGKQITDPDTGKRVYEINSYRLPSVTTILGATKNQEFLKEWKAKVGEQEDICRAPAGALQISWALHQYRSILAPRLRYITRVYTQVKQTWYVYTTILKLLLTSSRPIVRKRKNGSKIIIFKSQRTPWHTTTSTAPRYDKELSWYARLTYITKNLGSRTTNYGPGNTNF